MTARFLRFVLPFLLIGTLVGCSSGRVTTPPSGSSAPPAQSDASSSDASSDASSDEASSSADPDDRAAPDVDPDPEAAMAPVQAPEDWFHQDPDTGTALGIGTDRAYELLEGRTPKQTVTIAIIDSGVDIEHEDLEAEIWVNDDETPGNGVDDDGNGYVDDVHGWNFIGGPDGEHVHHDTYELTRLYRDLHARFAGVDSADVAPDARDEYARYQDLRSKFQKDRAEAKTQFNNMERTVQIYEIVTQILQKQLKTDSLTVAGVDTLATPTQRLRQAREVYLYYARNDISKQDLVEYRDYLKDKVEYNLNPDFEPRAVVGDDYSDKQERIYGNPDVEGPEPDHGTHVAGIVGATRTNDLGIRGVADGVELMILRAVPKGDERDKDIANAIRYAAANGADVINMSFGKSYSPHKSVVDDAVRYADSLGVLMVHAAGNDGANVDSTDSFPSPYFQTGERADLWVEVGASSWEQPDSLAASFSNYGAERVDVFAPGKAIYSSIPNNEYKRQPGTSMAAPMVSGLAGLLMAYFPELSAAEVKQILLETARRYDVEVPVPGGNGRTASFQELSRTGGVIDAPAAVQRALEMTE